MICYGFVRSQLVVVYHCQCFQNFASVSQLLCLDFLFKPLLRARATAAFFTPWDTCFKMYWNTLAVKYLCWCTIFLFAKYYLLFFYRISQTYPLLPHFFISLHFSLSTNCCNWMTFIHMWVLSCDCSILLYPWN